MNEFYINTNCNSSKNLYRYDVITSINQETIIRGVVRNHSGERVKDLAVEIIEIDKLSNNPTILGFVTTDENGEYVVAIYINKNKIYEFKIYDGIT